jgi:hypothetical protein
MGLMARLLLFHVLFSRLLLESFLVGPRMALRESIVMMVMALVLLEKVVELVLAESRVMLIHQVERFIILRVVGIAKLS